MAYSGLLRRVALVRTDVSEELSALVFIRSLRRLLVTASVFLSSPILVTLMKEAPHSHETSVLTRATQRHRRENLRSYDIRNCCINKPSYDRSDKIAEHVKVTPTGSS
jgi:hypothetical protein